MIFILSLILLLLVLSLPTLVSITRNSWYTNITIFLLNTMLVLVSLIIPYTNTTIDSISNMLLIFGYFILLSFIPDESNPKELTNKIKSV